MNLAFRRSKMISFRLSPEELERFQKLCSEHGIRSISDLARTALQRLAAKENGVDPLTNDVRDLRKQVRAMGRELDRISEIVETRHASGESRQAAAGE